MTNQYKRSFINLFDKETLAKEFTIEHSSSQVSFNSVEPIKFYQNVILTHVSGDIPDVAQKLHDIDAAASTASTAHGALVAGVSNNLISNVTTLETTITNLQTGLTNEISQRAAGQTADAAARVTAAAAAATAIDTEKTRALAAELVNANAISDLTTSSSSGLSIETDARIAAVSGLSDQVDFIKGNVNSDAVDSISELLTKMSDDDGSLLTTITTLQTQVSNLQAIVDQLTNEKATASVTTFDLVTQMSGLDASIVDSVTNEQGLFDLNIDATSYDYFTNNGKVWFDWDGDGTANAWAPENEFVKANFPSLD
jgi:hypothetical protein